MTVYLPPPAPVGTSSGSTQDPSALVNQLLSNQGLGSPFNYSAAVNPNDQLFYGRRVQSGRSGKPTEAVFRSIGDLMQEVYGSWDRGKIASVGSKFVSAGWLQPGEETNLDKVAQAYQRVLEMAVMMTKAGRYVTPDDILNSYIGGAGGPSRPASYTEVTKSVDLTNPKTARALLRQTLQDRLGRDPTPAEHQAFLAALHQAEREDPTVRKTKYKLDAATGQYQTESQTTQGGLDAQAYAQDYGHEHNQREAGAYQAAATFFPALMQAIGAPF
jgi:hypothetical protein